MAIEKLKDLATGWSKLGKVGKWTVVILTLAVLGGVVRGLELVGVLPDSDAEQARLAALREQRTPAKKAAPTPEPPVETVSPSDARLRLPMGINGYVMTALGDPQWTKTDPAVAAMARFTGTASDERVTVRVSQDAQSFEELGLGKAQKVKVGNLEGRQTADPETRDAGIHWRRGALLLQVFAHANPFDPKRALSEALRAAETVNRTAEDADSLAADERAARIANLSNAIDATKVAQLAIGGFAKSMPPWAVSVQAGPEERGVTVTVAALWLAADAKVREAQAKQLWQKWAATAAPGEPDSAHLTLVDATGKKVGGSGLMGSSISVEAR